MSWMKSIDPTPPTKTRDHASLAPKIDTVDVDLQIPTAVTAADSVGRSGKFSQPEALQEVVLLRNPE